MDLLASYHKEIRLILILALLYAASMVYQHGRVAYTAHKCDVATSYVQSFEICTKASPGSAFCMVSVHDLQEFRDSSYRLMTEACMLHNR